MGQRILVFEKNTDFVQELVSGFARLGGEVEIARDVESALEQAKAGQVDLVLVSADAMSTPGEVFSVCKRFKGDDDVARIPFIIMGAASHAESFEQHKKLKKRRADEYVELPVAFDALWAKVRPLVSWGSATPEQAAPADAGLDVDADIDAFAESAFGELTRGEAHAAGDALTASSQEASRGPASPVSDGMSFERSRLEALVDELTSRAEAAEERAGQAERKLKSAEASRSSIVPPPSPMGVSSRDYLDLREQLNRKDKELLALRDEITSRDRRLLEASDRTLTLERAQAELHDNLGEMTSRFEDAIAKVGQHEADLETARKRAEGLTTRLARADENGRTLEREFEATRQRHTAEMAERKAGHEQHAREMEEQAAADNARLRADHAGQIEQLTTSHQSAMSELTARTQAELAQARTAHETEVSGLRAAHAQATEAADREARARLEDERRAKESALAAAAADKASTIEALRNEHAGEMERTLAEGERTRLAALESQRNDLESKHAALVRERDDKHGKELTALGRKLNEADAKGAQLAATLADLDRAKNELESRLTGEIRNLEGHLAARTEERDLTQNELGSARAQIASLEQLAAQRAERIAQVETSLSHAEHRLNQLNAKIASDNELLERVRRALGIGVGLLEQQKNGAVDIA